MNNKKGFTLIELMIVVVIISILAAIVIPNFLAYKERQEALETEQAGEVIKSNSPKKVITENREKTKSTKVAIKCIDGFYVVIQGDNIFYLGNKDTWDDITAIPCK